MIFVQNHSVGLHVAIICNDATATTKTTPVILNSYKTF